MRWIAILAVAGITVGGLGLGAALPAQAEDDGAELAALRTKAKQLEQQNGMLREMLDMAQVQAKKAEEARQLTAKLLEASQKLAKALQERVRLLTESNATGGENQKLRMEWLRVQLHNAGVELKGKEEETRTYYGTLLVPLGASAAKVVADRLRTDPNAHAHRLAAILAAMGRSAEGTLPLLEKIAGDAKYRESGAASYAAKAIATIKANTATK